MTQSRIIPLTGPEADRQTKSADVMADELHTTRDQRRVFLENNLVAPVYHTAGNTSARLGLNSSAARGCWPFDICRQTDTGDIYICISNNGGASGDWQRLSASPVDLVPYNAYSTAVHNISTTAAKLTIDTEGVSDGNYSLSSNDITITAAGTYSISYSIAIDDDGSTGAQRGSVDAWIEADSVEIPQSRGRAYIREDSGGSGVSVSFIAALSASDVLSFYAQASSSTDISADLSQVSIFKLA